MWHRWGSQRDACSGIVRSSGSRATAQSIKSKKSMRAFMVFFIFSCSRSARCAIRMSLSDTCRVQRSVPSSQPAAVFSRVGSSCLLYTCLLHRVTRDGPVSFPYCHIPYLCKEGADVWQPQPLLTTFQAVSGVTSTLFLPVFCCVFYSIRSTLINANTINTFHPARTDSQIPVHSTTFYPFVLKTTGRQIWH